MCARLSDDWIAPDPRGRVFYVVALSHRLTSVNPLGIWGITPEIYTKFASRWDGLGKRSAQVG